MIYINDEGVEHFKAGRDVWQKFVTPKLVDITKQPHGLNPPTTQMAKNTCKYIRCSEYHYSCQHDHKVATFQPTYVG